MILKQNGTAFQERPQMKNRIGYPKKAECSHREDRLKRNKPTYLSKYAHYYKYEDA